MGFMDSYKHLEKLCGEVMNDERRVTAYIDEMVNCPRGAYLVSGWNDDLKQLKHYRWVRNQIVHEPNCSEETMCGSEDTQWIDDFYDRIMHQTDPLALYRKAAQAQSQAVRHKPVPQAYPYPIQTHHRNLESRGKPVGCAWFLMGVLVILAMLFI